MANGASLTNFTAEAHPSQPDYFALYAGSTFGVTDDNAYSLPGPTLYTTLNNTGISFTGYVDEGGGGSDFNPGLPPFHSAGPPSRLSWRWAIFYPATGFSR
jgi:hypothetical protein